MKQHITKEQWDELNNKIKFPIEFGQVVVSEMDNKYVLDRDWET